MWRPTSMINLPSNADSKTTLKKTTIKLTNTADNFLRKNNTTCGLRDKQKLPEQPQKGSSTIVNIVLVEATDIPAPPNDGSTHNLYLKFRLGTDTFKSKLVPFTYHPEWREKFKLRLCRDPLLHITLWDKEKQKNFMGRCVLDLSELEKERSHDLTLKLEDGYGLVHVSVTMCARHATPNDERALALLPTNNPEHTHIWYNLLNNWRCVGELCVRVVQVRGLCGKPASYCTLELDNETVQTPTSAPATDPVWDKTYRFNIYDISSNLNLKVYESNQFRAKLVGKLSVPLLRIYNGEQHWYALKDKANRNRAKGNTPRILLEMTNVWNPVKATFKLFRPQEVKYIKTPPKFNISLIYNDMEFVMEMFKQLYELNECIKRLFEWENTEFSLAALIIWICFWYLIELWMFPLLFLLPFLFNWTQYRYNKCYKTNVQHIEGSDCSGNKVEKTVTDKLQDLQDLTLTLTNGVDYMTSLAERVLNLVTFKVPFLSHIMMVIMVISSIILYTTSINTIFIFIGIYKFVRKYVNPKRKLNNDLLDFISRVPDNEILKDWKELSVPEPNQKLFQ